MILPKWRHDSEWVWGRVGHLASENYNVLIGISGLPASDSTYPDQEDTSRDLEHCQSKYNENDFMDDFKGKSKQVTDTFDKSRDKSRGKSMKQSEASDMHKAEGKLEQQTPYPGKSKGDDKETASEPDVSRPMVDVPPPYTEQSAITCKLGFIQAISFAWKSFSRSNKGQVLSVCPATTTAARQGVNNGWFDESVLFTHFKSYEAAKSFKSYDAAESSRREDISRALGLIHCLIPWKEGKGKEKSN